MKIAIFSFIFCAQYKIDFLFKAFFLFKPDEDDSFLLIRSFRGNCFSSPLIVFAFLMIIASDGGAEEIHSSSV